MDVLILKPLPAFQDRQCSICAWTGLCSMLSWSVKCSAPRLSTLDKQLKISDDW